MLVFKTASSVPSVCRDRKESHTSIRQSQAIPRCSSNRIVCWQSGWVITSLLIIERNLSIIQENEFLFISNLFRLRLCRRLPLPNDIYQAKLHDSVTGAPRACLIHGPPHESCESYRVSLSRREESRLETVPASCHWRVLDWFLRCNLRQLVANSAQRSMLLFIYLCYIILLMHN